MLERAVALADCGRRYCSGCDQRGTFAVGRRWPRQQRRRYAERWQAGAAAAAVEESEEHPAAARLSHSRAGGRRATRRSTLQQAGELRGEAAAPRRSSARSTIPVRSDDVHRRVAADRPEPDRAGRRRSSGRLRRDERPHRRAGHPAGQRHGSSSAPRRAASGCTTRRRGTWSAKTDDQPTLAIGALAVAPSNDAIVYAGTGEGALSGDSYFGNGVLKSTDGGNTWANVSGDNTSAASSMSRIVVDPTEREPPLCRGAPRPRRRPAHAARPSTRQFGIWESTDGGVNWKLLQEVEGHARRDRPRDRSAEPADPVRLVLGRRHLQDHRRRQELEADHERPAGRRLRRRPTRFSIGDLASAPAGAGTLYAGFDWVDGAGHHPVAGLQVDQRRRELGDRCPAAPARTRSRTTAAPSAPTTT